MTASLIYAYGATIPAGTAQAAPVTIDLMFPPAVVERVVITVPPGPSGLVGFQLWVLGGQALPSNAGAWIVANDRVITWDVAGQPDSGAWQLTGYNTDIYDHALQVEFYATPAVVAGNTAMAAASDATTAALLASGAG